MNSGMGQRYIPDQLSWSSQYGLGLKTGGELSPGSRKAIGGMGMPQQPTSQPQQMPQGQQKPRKGGLFGEDDDSEPSLYFPQTSVFRPDREMMTNSPSQMSGGLTGTSQLAAGLMANSQLAGLMANAQGGLSGTQSAGSFGLTGSQSSLLSGNNQLSGGLSVSSQLNQLTSGLTGNLQLSGSSQLPGSSQPSMGFGSSQNSGGFGTAQNSSGFGGSQNAGGFGTSQPSGGFGTSQSSGGFGTSQSSGGFGTSQSSGGFGTSQSSGGFGTSQSSGGFGTSQPSGGFGTPQNSFGISQSTTGSGFGTSQSGSGFGTSQSGSGFGSSSTSSGFGSSGLPGTSQASSGFGSNFYTPGLGNLAAFQQRGGMTGPQFRGNNATPTSMNPNFPLNLQAPQQPSPNRNITSAIGGQRINQNLANLQKRSVGSGLTPSNPPLNSMNNSYMFGQSSRQIFGNDENQPSLDLSEFPTLGNRGSLQNSSTVSSSRNYVGMVSKPASESTPEFQIQQEDFPALPGAQNPPSSSSADSASKTPTSTATGIFDQNIAKKIKFPGDKAGQQKRGIQTHPDGTVTNIPSGMVTDQFGIVGLLTFIRAAENDPNLVALAPGIDLTNLGLNLNSPENLYSTFQSPWADSPCRPQDIDFHVPAEYLTNIFIREKLAPIKLNRYTEDLLFFLFYMNGGDVLQLAAATELYNRDWRYHKEERVWITRAPGVEPIVKTNTYERGTYYFFDAQNWRKVAKEFHLEYDKLEERPTLPPTIHHNANQPIVAH